MDAKKDDTFPVHVDEVKDGDDEKPAGKVVHEENVHSVALAEAVLSQKPSPWSKNMLKLYFIMGKILKTTMDSRSSLIPARHWISGIHSQWLRFFSDGSD